jgi:hypothetical protein
VSTVPGDLSTDHQPPIRLPLAHFLVALAFLLAGAAVGLASALGEATGLAGLAHVHLLLVGWVCVTIMGAMTQFVPVWSGVPLHSQRVARWSLALAALGVAGLAWAFWTVSYHWIHGFGGFVVLGVYGFVYNLARTLSAARPLDRTEAHFAFALAAFAVVVALGFLLAMDFSLAVLPLAGVTRPQVVGAHATLAVFGVVVGTMLGALYQLGTMFTQTELHGVDHGLRRVEYGYPVGVVVLAAGRLVSSRPVAVLGAALVCAGGLAFAAILVRKLWASQVERNPMLTRYAAAALALAAWSVLALAAWVQQPLARVTLFGPTAAVHLLFVGVVGFVVMGSLYHVIPFIVWEHRYSDRLGFERVPMLDDLYSDWLAAADGLLVAGGALALVLASAGVLPGAATTLGGVVLAVGCAAFAANLAHVVWKHGGYLPSALGAAPGDAD